MFRKLYQILYLCLALLAYVANGAQTHLQFGGEQVISVPLCNGMQTSTVDLVIGHTPTEKDQSTCCGDCSPSMDVNHSYAVPVAHIIVSFIATGVPQAPFVQPKSPLWPGAPPQGPPPTLV